MKQAMDIEVGGAFKWQKQVYRVTDHVSFKDGSIDTVMVQCVADQWTKDIWRTVVGRQQERFNPYCEVQPVTLSVQVTDITDNS